MRTTRVVAFGFLLALAGLSAWASPPAPGDDDAALESGFRDRVRPFLASYCVDCHGKDEPEGDIDLTAYASAGSVARDLPRWDLVLERLREGTMPPKKAKRRPEAEDRRGVIAWVESVRAREAARNAGDPGPVHARRLSNAEYDHTVRDLTGVDIRPTRAFPVDPANEAGFDNSAESLAMSPALVKKYLDAAREVAEHVVLTPDGLAFAPHPVVTDTDRDKYSVRRVIDFYKRQPTDLAEYVLAAWRYRHRAAMNRPDATLDDLAAEARVSPKYLATVWAFLTGPSAEVGPVAAVRSLWDGLPGPARGADAARVGCRRLADFVAELRGLLTPEVKNLTVPGMNNGAQPLVLWKNRQYVANRRRYAGNAGSVKRDALTAGTDAARALALPADPEACRADFERFCATFPDAFLVSERARVYLDAGKEKQNAGRLLSAGFHSMTGFFRDDAPLAELILDDAGRRELDRLWDEFDVITGAPARQYASFLWFERTDSRYMRDPQFDFARAEDKGAASEDMVRRLAEVYTAKARDVGASETALEAVRDFFTGIDAQLRRVERAKREAEPAHVEALKALAGRAYRRPLSAAERDGVAAFYRSLRDDDGLNHEDAVRDTVAGILMSPNFCYRVDLPGADPRAGTGAGSGVRPLSDYDLASRLSYFLWSSMPDDRLLALAAAGTLHRPGVLAAEARRMLRDDRVRGLATEFAGNWLDFRRFEEHNSVDRGRFPAFDDALRRSMFEEPVRFFVDMVRNNRPVHELLDGRHTFVDAPLARHYGMPEPAPSAGGDGWARVDDATAFGRGGLLPMAVFLTKNSPGLRTSPVKRGYWVVRRLLGEPIPAPPANVPDLPDDESKLGDATLRQALARHRADVSCAGCHERFDSIGLAFEGYGPVGEFRTLDLGGRPVDTRATFPAPRGAAGSDAGSGAGSEGVGVEGLRAYLGAARRGEFVDNLCRKLLAYGLGRGLLPSDDATLAAMRGRLGSEGGRFGGLVECVVTSPQFLNKRVESEQAE